MPSRVFTFHPLADELYMRLSKHAQIDTWTQERTPSTNELIQLVQQYDAILTTPRIQITREITQAVTRTKLFSQYAVGYDNLDVQAIVDQNLLASHTPGVLDETVAQFTIGLLIALTRNILQGDRFVREGQWKGGFSKKTLWGHDLHAKRFAILGMGRTGTAVAKLAKNLNLRLFYHNRHPNPTGEHLTGAKYCNLAELLQNADVLTIHLPLTPQTRHLIQLDELHLMPQGSILINMARGPIVHTPSLIQALQENHLAGAALDVMEPEPLPADHPLCKLPNVILSPHLGSATFETRHKMATLAVDNIIQVLQGKPPLTPIKA